MSATPVYTVVMKHLIDLDEDALRAARARLGTTTIRETVNAALQLAAGGRQAEAAAALDVLASLELEDRERAWH